MEYYSDIKKKILSFATFWVKLESIMLSEVSQTEKENAVGSHRHVESKQGKFRNGCRMAGCWGGGWRKWGDVFERYKLPDVRQKVVRLQCQHSDYS